MSDQGAHTFAILSRGDDQEIRLDGKLVAVVTEARHGFGAMTLAEDIVRMIADQMGWSVTEGRAQRKAA